MPLKNSVRFKIFKRDAFKCQYCGSQPPAVVLEVDHILPSSKGGSDDLVNLITSCFSCNRGKRDGLLSDKPMLIIKAQEEEVEKFKQLDAFNRFLKAKRKIEAQWLKSISDVFITLRGKDPAQYRMSGDVESSCKTFLKRMPCEKIIEALYIAHAKRNGLNSNYDLKYFYGTCWKMIRDAEAA